MKKTESSDSFDMNERDASLKEHGNPHGHEDALCGDGHHHDDDDDGDDEDCACHSHNHHHDDEDGEEGCGCCHHHGHSHGDDDDDEEEHSLPKIIIAAVLFAAGLLIEKLPVFALTGSIAHGDSKIFMWIKVIYMAFYFAAYILCGRAVIREAVEGLLGGHVFGEEFLMAVATIGAIVMGEYSEAVAVMILFQLGEFLEDLAVGKSRKSITALMDVRPDKAWLKSDGGEAQEVLAKSVAVGQTVVVRPGERVPLDGIVVKGSSLLDTSALTGESVPRQVAEGQEILSGCVNTSGVLEVKVSRPFEKSTASRILELVEHAQGKKARTEKFISRFARVYTPIVCILAVMLAVIPPTVLGLTGHASAGIWRTWIYRALELLVVSCPCALVISVPLSFFAGIGLASRKGILVKGSNYMELLSQAKTVVFDKTGTLTKGVFQVTEVHVADPSVMGQEELVALATHAEYYSKHPISLSLKNAHHCPLCRTVEVDNTEEISGHGLKCKVDGHAVLVGNAALMQRENVSGYTECSMQDLGTVVHVARDGAYMGHIVISDVSKEDAVEAIKALKKLGIEKTVMLTGDAENVAKAQSKKLGLDEYHAELLPDGKVSKVEELLSAYNGSKKRLAFVGDGINDALVLTRSDVGIAMGAMGSDAAIEAADVVIMDDMPGKVALAIKLGKKTMSNVWQNVWFALGVKTLIMVLCACGLANMWIAVFGDVGVTMLAVLNAMRLHWKK